jgi:hypothetical protein
MYESLVGGREESSVYMHARVGHFEQSRKKRLIRKKGLPAGLSTKYDIIPD